MDTGTFACILAYSFLSILVVFPCSRWETLLLWHVWKELCNFKPLPLSHQKPQWRKAIQVRHQQATQIAQSLSLIHIFLILRNFVQVWLLRKDVHCKWQLEASSQISPFASCCKRLQHYQLIPSRTSPSEVDLIHILYRVHVSCSSGTHFNRIV